MEDIEFNITLIPREDGGLRVCSDDLPGLVLSGPDPQKVMADVWPAIQVLRAFATATHTPGK